MLGIDDFALRRSRSYATVLIDAETGRRVDVLPGRTADLVEEWLRDHPGVQIVCRDGSGAYCEAVRRALAGAVQVSDRWHLWHGLAEVVQKEVAEHSGCWAQAGPPQAGKRAGTTLERWQQIHGLLAGGTGLRECARRLDLSLSTVKRYACAGPPERPQRPAAPAHPGRSLPRPPPQAPGRGPRGPGPAALREIRELGYPGSSTLLVRYISQGRIEADRPHLSPRRAARLLLSRPSSRTAASTRSSPDSPPPAPR